MNYDCYERLNPKEREAIDSLPDDLPDRLMKGDWWDGNRWWTSREAVEQIARLTAERDEARQIARDLFEDRKNLKNSF